jgi:hypothetical protein
VLQLLTKYAGKLQKQLAASQYRYDIEEYLDDPVTAFTYPVFDSFGDDRQLAGVLANEYQLEAFLYEDSSSFRLRNCVYTGELNQTLAIALTDLM